MIGTMFGVCGRVRVGESVVLRLSFAEMTTDADETEGDELP
jgi:hypothetical protein